MHRAHSTAMVFEKKECDTFGWSLANVLCALGKQQIIQNSMDSSHSRTWNFPNAWNCFIFGVSTNFDRLNSKHKFSNFIQTNF